MRCPRCGGSILQLGFSEPRCVMCARTLEELTRAAKLAYLSQIRETYGSKAFAR